MKFVWNFEILKKFDTIRLHVQKKFGHNQKVFSVWKLAFFKKVKIILSLQNRPFPPGSPFKIKIMEFLQNNNVDIYL